MTAVGDPLDPGLLRKLQQRAQLALAAPLQERGIPLDADHRTEHLSQNLAAPLTPEQLSLLSEQFEAGAGGELHAAPGKRPKLHSAHSSAALAVSTFGPLLDRPHELRLAGRDGFEQLALEVKLPTGVRGTPPHLDAVAAAADGRVAVESKCTEQLAPKAAKFSDAYGRLAKNMHASWHTVYKLLLAEPEHFQLLDAAQLIKHYWGLANTRTDGIPDTLLYLYWEPTDAGAHVAFERHAAEARAFAERVADPACRFVAQSYPTLWDGWDQAGGSLAVHTAALRDRYAVAVGAAAQ